MEGGKGKREREQAKAIKSWAFPLNNKAVPPFLASSFFPLFIFILHCSIVSSLTDDLCFDLPQSRPCHLTVLPSFASTENN